MLPRQVSKRPRITKTKAKGWAGLQPEDLEGIEGKLCDKFKWKHSPREFQIEAIKAQLLRKDVLVHAGTGAGKTMIAAGPHAMTDSKGMVSFVVSPLIALQEEQAQTFRDEFGLRATAINSAHEGCTNEVMNKICDGEWQIVLISPEIMLSAKFRDNVILNPKMASRILAVVVDEAHVISHWGADFRKDYGQLGILRSMLPAGTPFVAMSATLSRKIRRDVLKKLEFNEKAYLNLDIGNDRSNVSIVVRSIHNTMATFSDMDFVIPKGVTRADDIPLTFIYADKISDGVGIEERLTELLPESLRDQGLIRPYSAAYTVEHREIVMELFRAGIIRVLVCTDAAGMGCNIPDIDVVVQWKLPTSVSAFVQRAGRAARDPKRTGIAVLLVEKTVFDADLSNISESNAKNITQKGVQQSTAYPKAPKGYAIKHGVQRGSHHGKSDENHNRQPVPLDAASPDEGLYTLAQTGGCRREVLTQIYENKTPQPTVPCCDICEPSLLDRVRPSPPDATTRKPQVKTGTINMSVKTALQKWRREIWQRDFKNAMFNASAILKDDTLETLASVGPLEGLDDLERVVGEEWPWLDKYGDELLQTMAGLAIAPMEPRPTQRRTEKRPLVAENEDGASNTGEDDASRKRRTTGAATSNPSMITSVNQDSLGLTPRSVTHQQPSAQHAPSMYFPYHHIQSLPAVQVPSTLSHQPTSPLLYGAPYYTYSQHPGYPMPYMYSSYQYNQYPQHAFSHAENHHGYSMSTEPNQPRDDSTR
ncbi:P-loop containing nucleoside triphosphate hydrolase protein [Agrocybe pediades]|nr:P-loop containing nucleoside triphosphate hydrolase protein [Agrocybe pediades]